MRYSLRQLQVFITTARHENISRAAEELAMSQSAASGALKELENQFGIKLFDRVGKRLRLSELGQQLRPQAENLLAQARDFERALADQDVAGQLNIGATLTIGNYLAVGLIAEYRQRYPGADIALSVANTESIAERVASFDLDMGMIEGELNHPELQVAHWRGDELSVFAAPDYPLPRTGKLKDRDLQKLPWILRERGSGTRQTFDRAMQGILPDLEVAMELQHTEAIKRAVEAGLGVGCLSQISLAEAFKRGSLIPVPVAARDFSRDLYLITHRDKFHGESLQRWITLCQDSV